MSASAISALGLLAIAIAAVIGVAILSLPFLIAHRAVVTRRQLKKIADLLQQAEGQFTSPSFSNQPGAAQERDAYAFLVAFRSKARFLRWFYWISIVTIPLSGWGLLMLAIWGLENSKFSTGVRAATGMKPKVLAIKLCVGIEEGLKTEASARS